MATKKTQKGKVEAAPTPAPTPTPAPAKRRAKAAAPAPVSVPAKKAASKKVAPSVPPAKKATAKKKAARKTAQEKPQVSAPVTAAPLEEPEGIDQAQAWADELGLTPKQKSFADNYLIDFNGTQAAIRAGYSPHTANEQSSQLLAKLNIKTYVDRRNADLSEKTGLTAELVRRQWLGILTTDTNELIEFRRTCCRYCYGQDYRYQRTAGEMERDRERYEIELAKAKDVNPNAEFAPFDEKGGIGFYAIKAPNPDCPECCGEGIGDVFFKDTRYLSPAARELYAGAKIGKDGIEVKTHNKDAVREIVSKHLNMFETTLEVNHTVTATKDALDAIYQLGIETMEQQRQAIIERRKRREADRQDKKKAG